MKRREFAMYVAPSVIVMVVLMIIPLMVTLYLSFTRFSYGQTPTWIGWDNYLTTLDNSRFWNSVWFTLKYIAVTIPTELVLGFAIALVLDNVSRFRGLVVSGSLLPFVVTPVVGTLIFSWLFQDKWGFYAWLLSFVGVNVQWYAEVWASQLLLMIYGVWVVTPFVFLVLYAGLQAMPREPLESAEMDGANWFQKVRYIIIPHLRALIGFILMVNIMDSYRLFDSVYVMTRGGPGNATETLMFYNYQVAFTQLSLGRGAAVSILTVIGIFVLLIPSLYQTFREQVEARG